jgi:hypothetical protein
MKQKDKARRPDIDALETVMREERKLGYFVNQLVTTGCCLRFAGPVRP